MNGNAIFEAIKSGNPDEVKRLIESNPVLLSEPGDDNLTPLHVAAREGQTDIALWLITHGANMEAVDAQHGATPLNWAAYFARAETVRALLDTGADPKRENAYGKSAYQVAEAGVAGEWKPFTNISPETYKAVVDVLHQHGAADTRRPSVG